VKEIKVSQDHKVVKVPMEIKENLDNKVLKEKREKEEIKDV
jgi:hypothetical protein